MTLSYDWADSDLGYKLVGLTVEIASDFRCRNNSQFDELVSAGLVGAAEAMNNYRPESGKFVSFAAVCIYRRMVDSVRNDCRQFKIRRRFQDHCYKELVEIDPDKLSDEDRYCFERRIRVLTPKQKQVFYLRYMHDMSFPEIAEHLGVSISVVHMRHYHGMIAIRASIGERRCIMEGMR